MITQFSQNMPLDTTEAMQIAMLRQSSVDPQLYCTWATYIVSGFVDEQPNHLSRNDILEY